MRHYYDFADAVRNKWSIAFALALLAAILIVPGSLYSKAMAGDTDQEMAPTCASVYSAIMADYADKNYLAMVHNYYLLSDLSEERASEEASKGALRLYSAMNAGTLTEDDVMSGARSCAARFNIPLPIALSRVHFPSYVTEAEAYAVNNDPEPVAEVSAADQACGAAREDYIAAVQSAPGVVDAAGSAQLENGLPNSQYYYTLGRMCDSMKVVENAVGKSCGWAEQPEKLDICK